MLFYVKGEPKKGEGPPAIPAGQLLEYVVKEWETVLEFREQGAILGAYGYADHPGGFIIYDVSSREELENLLSKLPMHALAQFEIIPLITADAALARAKQGKLSGPAP